MNSDKFNKNNTKISMIINIVISLFAIVASCIMFT